MTGELPSKAKPLDALSQRAKILLASTPLTDLIIVLVVLCFVFLSTFVVWLVLRRKTKPKQDKMTYGRVSIDEELGYETSPRSPVSCTVHYENIASPLKTEMGISGKPAYVISDDPPSSEEFIEESLCNQDSPRLTDVIHELSIHRDPRRNSRDIQMGATEIDLAKLNEINESTISSLISLNRKQIEERDNYLHASHHRGSRHKAMAHIRIHQICEKRILQIHSNRVTN